MSAGECACAVRVRGVGCESASACVHVSDVSARVRVRVMPEVDMATQSEAHVAQMHASASDPARAREGKGGRGAHAQAGPECSAAAPRCITEACAPGRVSAAARACACTAGPHLPGSRRRVLPKALARQTLRARQHGRRSAPPSTWRTRLPLAVAHAGTRGRAAAVRTRANSPIRTCSAPGITGRPVMPVRAATNSAAPRRTPLHRQLSFVARRLHHCAILLSSSAGQRESLAFGKVFILGHTLLTKKNSRREFDHFGRSDDEREVARAIERARGYEKIWFRVYCQGRKKGCSTLCTLVFTVRAYACKLSSCFTHPPAQ